MSLLVAVPAAHADEDLVTFADGETHATLGPNAVLRVDGRLRSFKNCPTGGINDFVYPASDLYVVRAGEEPEDGSRLEDAASNTPTTIVQGGSAFVAEILAITGPTGSLGPGEYSVVVDTCQDGAFQAGTDSVFRDLITVVYPPVIPPEDDAIAALKSNAHTQWGNWQQIGKLFDTLLNVDKAAGCGKAPFERGGELQDAILGCLEVISIWVDSPAISEWISATGKIKQATECRGNDPGACFGLVTAFWGLDTSPIRTFVTSGAKSLIANQAKAFFGIYADPPRSDFMLSTSVIQPDLPIPQTQGDGPIFDRVSEFATALEREQLLWTALLAAIERYQGARAAGDSTSAATQARSAAGIATALTGAVPVTADLLGDWFDTVQSEIPAFDAINQRGHDDLYRWRTQGFNATEDQALRNAGIAGGTRADHVDELTAALAGNIAAPFLNLEPVDAIKSGVPAQQGLLRDLAEDLEALASTIDGANAVPSLEILSSTAPETGAPVTLRAVATPNTTVEWDLDNDGDFTDASGADVSSVFLLAGHRVVAARATASSGVAVTAHALLDVRTSNRPPVVETTAPMGIDGAAYAHTTVGAAQQFEVTVRDPEDDTLRYAWFVDGDLVDAANGPSVTIAATAALRGPHTVSVQVQDSQPGNVVVHAWRWQIDDPDADGDTWAANDVADCDDGSASVHPRILEVLLNGQDDDCDPATPDEPIDLDGLGQLWGWGSRDAANGTGSGAASSTPRYQGVDDVEQVVSASIAGALLDGKGQVWAWGSGGMPGAGEYRTTPVLSPQPVVGPDGGEHLSGVTALSAASSWFGARTVDGRVLTWGNAGGYFGQGRTEAELPTAPTPGFVVDGAGEILTGVAHIEAAHQTGYAIRDDGSVWLWGMNLCEAGGVRSSTFARPAPWIGDDVVQIEGSNQTFLARYSDGTVGWCADPTLPVQRLGSDTFGGERIVDVATTFNLLGGVVLTESGRVWVSGDPSAAWFASLAPVNGGVISPTTWTEVEMPAGAAGAQLVRLDSADMACAVFGIRDDGTALSWGSDDRNCDGQGASSGDGSARLSPAELDIDGFVEQISGGRYTGLAVVRRAGGDVWTWGQGIASQRGDNPSPGPMGLTNVVQISHGDRMGYALKANGDVWGWGGDDAHVVGIGSGRVPAPVFDVGSTSGALRGVVEITDADPSAYFLLSDGRVASVGYDLGSGSLGAGTAMHARNYPDLVLGPDTNGDGAADPISDVTRIWNIGGAGLVQRQDGSFLQWGARQCADAGWGARPVTTLAVEEPVLTVQLAGLVQAVGSGNNPGSAIFRLADGSVRACGAERQSYPEYTFNRVLPFGDFGPENPAVDVDSNGNEWWVVTARGDVWVKSWSGDVLTVPGCTPVLCPPGILFKLPVPAGAHIVDVEAGGDVQLRRADGTLVTWSGENTFQSVGHPAVDNPTPSHLPAELRIDGHVLQSETLVWNGFALVMPNSAITATAWTPPQPDVRVSVTGATGSEGGTATARIHLSSPASAALGIEWQFEGAVGTTTVPAGGTTADLVLTLPARDGIWGADRESSVTLTTVGLGASIDDESAVITIVDNDPAPDLSIAPDVVDEGDAAPTGRQLTVRLAAAAAVDIPVRVESADLDAIAGVDYTALAQDVVIPAGETVATLPFVLLGNRTPEADRAFRVTAVPGESRLAAASAEIAIRDDDPAVIEISTTRVPAGQEAKVLLSSPGLPVGEELRVSWRTADLTAVAPTDYASAEGVAIVRGGEQTSLAIQTRVGAPGDASESGEPGSIETRALRVTLQAEHDSRAVLGPTATTIVMEREVEGPGSAAFSIEHRTVAADGQIAVARTESKSGSIGDRVTAIPLNPVELPGFTYTPGFTSPGESEQTTGLISADGGLVLRLYYSAVPSEEPERPTVRVVHEVIDAGARQEAQGSGFLPFERVTGVMQSEPLALGTQTADAEGHVRFNWTVPSTTSPGAHTVILTSEDSGVAQASFTVTAPAVPADPTPRPSHSVVSTLSATGSPPFAPFTVAAALLLIIGFGAFMLGRRRRRS